jgi:protein TonB
MFATLLESPAPRERTTTGTVISVIFHSGVLALALTASHDISTARSTPPPEVVSYVQPLAPITPLAASPAAATVASLTRPALGFAVLQSPIAIPDVLPTFDLSRAVTDAAQFTGRGGVAGGTPDGVVGGTPLPAGGFGGVFALDAVDKAAIAIEGVGVPEYPSMLREAGIEGTVRLRFVIDTLGRAEPGSVVVLSSTHELFTVAVERAVPRMRFKAAEVRGTRVRQWVEMPLVFSLRVP